MSALDRAHDEVERARTRLDGATSELRRAVAADGAGPARDVTDALGRLDALRTAIARDVDTLRTRATAAMATGGARRSVTGAPGGLGGLVAGVGAVGAVTAGLVGRRRAVRRREERAFEARARAVAAELRASDPTARSGRARRLTVAGALLGVGVGVAVVAARRRARDEDLWLPEG